MKKQVFIVFAFLFISMTGYSQPCTVPGQNPSTALSICGSTAFIQTVVPTCLGNNLFVPGCSDMFNNYEYANRNAFWYRFTCSTSGTLGFLISPHARNEDYDWQLFDITGHNPDDVYKDTSLVVAGNWAGSLDETGASAIGILSTVCASEAERFSKMPELIEDHEYLLLISHVEYTNGQSGYTLSFDGGTAVINDTTEPHFQKARLDCGNEITLKLNKKMRCGSLTPTGSEFSLSTTGATIVSARANACFSGALYFDEVTITLSNTLADGNYQLIINYGSDGNTFLDDCDRSIPSGEQVPFLYNSIRKPMVADSIGRPGCSPSAVKIYFPGKIDCSTVAANGSDFMVNGPSPVTVIGAAGDCADGFSEAVTVRFSAPIYTKGNYFLTLKLGIDGTTISDDCGIEMPQQTLAFRTEDTVSAGFKHSSQYGCHFNTLTFSHDGAHGVNAWNWIFNKSINVATQNHTIVFPASSTNDAQLIVSNGTCTDTASNTMTMNNEVKADFNIPVEICPADPVIATNTSTGQVDSWNWNFGNIGLSTAKNPAPQYFPQNNIESYYIIELKISNNILGCTDSVRKRLRIMNSCFIAVPSAFTPNGDGKNDFLFPNNALSAKDLEFKVFNRWAQLVFSTHNWREKWDGTAHGIKQPQGVFVWYLKYAHSVTGEKIFNKGTTMLIR